MASLSRRQRRQILRAHLRLHLRLERALFTRTEKMMRKEARVVASEWRRHQNHELAVQFIELNAPAWERMLAATMFSTARRYRVLAASQIQRGRSKGVVYADTKLGENFGSLFDEQLREYLAEHAHAAITGITEVTRIEISNFFDAIYGSGRSINVREIAAELRQRLTVRARVRAKAIARTETHNAAMFSAKTHAEATGMNLTKEWLTNLDGRERPWHREADKQERPLALPFRVGPDLMQQPGDRDASPGNLVNCRCTVIYKEAA